ncbi:hypothetical protein E4T56_gene15919 [Termitomyces sp. T112]|nr:hypothetical protein E4T56_gene15919 [Termitomyces sp. T112]
MQPIVMLAYPIVYCIFILTLSIVRCDYDGCIDLHLLGRRNYRAASCDAFELVWVQGAVEIWAPEDDFECDASAVPGQGPNVQEVGIGGIEGEGYGKA